MNDINCTKNQLQVFSRFFGLKVRVQGFQGLDLKKVESKLQGLDLKKPEVQVNSTRNLNFKLKNGHTI